MQGPQVIWTIVAVLELTPGAGPCAVAAPAPTGRARACGLLQRTAASRGALHRQVGQAWGPSPMCYEGLAGRRLVLSSVGLDGQ